MRGCKLLFLIASDRLNELWVSGKGVAQGRTIASQPLRKEGKKNGPTSFIWIRDLALERLHNHMADYNTRTSQLSTSLN